MAASPDAPKSAAPRALALDALRGFAIFAMCLSGVLPWGGLPSWMYHAQYKPITNNVGLPSIQYDGNWPGYTWVDLVFPAFLFSMGVAFPFALNSRLRKGVPAWKLVGGIFWRGVVLAAFAIYVQHIAPHTISGSPDARVLLQSFTGFLLLFPILAILPEGWKPELKMAIRAVGLIGAVVLLSQIQYPEKSVSTSFNVRRSDIIIMVLANMAVWGSLIWLVTRNNLLARLGAMALVAAALEADKVGGSWVNWLLAPKPPAALANRMNYWLGVSDFSWFYSFAYAKYLLIVLPGTIIGELLMKWMAKSDNPEDHGQGNLPLGYLSAFVVAIVVAAHIGLHARNSEGVRWLNFYLPFLMIPVLWIGWVWIRGFAVTTKTDELLRALYGWGAFWLVMGLLFEPVGGGIKKDPSTMSYYFVSTGMSIFLLLALTIWIDLFKGEKWFRLAIWNGQNPMIAYAGIQSLIKPIVMMPIPGIGSLEAFAFKLLQSFGEAPSAIFYWSRAVWSLAKTLGLSLVVGQLTRLRVIWRA
jgi:predicted acyltransferase